MSFDVGPAAYTAFMGRYSEPLAVKFADLAGVTRSQRALDVGCGAGALTAELVRRLRPASVWGVDPSESLAAATARRLPGVRIGRAAAEQLPFTGAEFDIAAAQLVVHFMTDPVAGLREMARVVRPGGTVAACVWDHAGERSPLAVFWQAARQLNPRAPDESDLPGVREGHLAELFAQAGLSRQLATSLAVTVTHDSFDEWWQPFTLGVGPAGAYLRTLSVDQQDALMERCRTLLPAGSFEIRASVWAVTAQV